MLINFLQAMCGQCSKNKVMISYSNKKERVCNGCYKKYMATKKKHPHTLSSETAGEIVGNQVYNIDAPITVYAMPHAWYFDDSGMFNYQ